MESSSQTNRPKATVRDFYERHQQALDLHLVAGQRGLLRVIREPTVNRPGLVLAGFTKYFAQHRVQVLGNAEMHFLKSVPEADRNERLARLLSYRVPCIVFCRGYRPDGGFLEMAERSNLPVFRSQQVTMRFINQATLLLDVLCAPQGTEMGSMVDIQGIGVIIRGAAGVGKSECVLGLIERGYSLVADDITHLHVSGGQHVIGTAHRRIREFMEVRGIGIINVADMFGVKSIRTHKRVDLVVTLKPWDEVANVERVGLDQEKIPLLGIEVPHVTIPVAPGRDLARLVEVAAFLVKLRLAGHNPAKDLETRLLADMAGSRREPHGLPEVADHETRLES